MKKFLLGVVVGVILICASGIVSAMFEMHIATKARDRAVKAEAAARAAADAAAHQAPIR
jgi:predicted outer membrane lipoprotein